jgi:hypothetical protein
MAEQKWKIIALILLITTVTASLAAVYDRVQFRSANDSLQAQVDSSQQTLKNLQANYTKLEADYQSHLQNEASLQSAFQDLFGSTPFVSVNYSFSPPIPMYLASIIALESGGWNKTNLANMTVHVSLNYDAFWVNSTGPGEYNATSGNETIHFSSQVSPSWGFARIREVTEAANDYYPKMVNGTTYRYIWSVAVSQNGYNGIPPPGLYFVDAATAELVPAGLLI